MSDLVERLRDLTWPADEIGEAADELSRLRAENERLIAALVDIRAVSAGWKLKPPTAKNIRAFIFDVASAALSKDLTADKERG